MTGGALTCWSARAALVRLAQAAKVSRSRLYRQDALRAELQCHPGPSPGRDHGTTQQRPSPSANSWTPTERDRHAYEPRTVPSRTSSPPDSVPNEQTTSPGGDHRRRHVHDVKGALLPALSLGRVERRAVMHHLLARPISTKVGLFLRQVGDRGDLSPWLHSGLHQFSGGTPFARR